MSKTKAILLFSFIIFAITSILLLSRGRVKTLSESAPKINKEPQVDMAKLRAEYSENVGKVMAEFEDAAKQIEIASGSSPLEEGAFSSSTAREVAASLPSLDKLQNLKSDIENLRAPSADYKDLHLDLMLSVAAMEGYVKSLFSQDRMQAVELIQKVRVNYEKMLNL